MIGLQLKLKSGININYKNVFQFEKVFDKIEEKDLLHIAGTVNQSVCYDKYPFDKLKGIEFK